MAGNHNSGRRPQPTALKVLRGNPGKRRPNAAEPSLPPSGPEIEEPPVEIAGDPVAVAEWSRIVPLLRSAGMVSELERPQLVALCQQWSRYLAAQSRLAGSGMVLKGSRGEPIVNPFLAVSDKALANCQKLWVELGITPSARSRIRVTTIQEKETSKWAGLIG